MEFLVFISLIAVFIAYVDKASSRPQYTPLAKSTPTNPESKVVDEDEEAYRRRPLAYYSNDKSLYEFYKDMGVTPDVAVKRMSDGTEYEAWDLGNHDFV